MPPHRRALTEILATTVYIDGANRPFGELTVEQARGRADELRAAVGFGPTVRVAPVAQRLAGADDGAGAGRGRDGRRSSTRPSVMELAPKLWIVPPGGTLL